MANTLIELFKNKAFTETPSAKEIQPEVLRNYLNTFYQGNEPKYSNGFAAMSAQAMQLCDHMQNLGFNNFAGLKRKFIYAPNDEHSAKMITSIKEAMEAILFKIENSHVPKAELVAKYKDRVFACNDGTLSNLQGILGELSLEQKGVDAYIIAKKRDMLTQLTLECYRAYGMYEFVESLPGMEIHNITSLLNSIAPNYNLQKKSREEDHYLKKVSLSTHNFLLKYIENALNSEKVFESFLDSIAGEITSNLPVYDKETIAQEGGYYRFQQDLEASLATLKLDINFVDLLKHDEDYLLESYRPNIQQIIKHVVAINLHERGIVLNPDIELLKLKLEIEKAGSIDDDLLNQTKQLNILEEITKYAIANNLKFGEIDAMRYAIDNNIAIDKVSALEYAVINDLKVDGKEAVKYADEQGITFNVKIANTVIALSAFEYVKLKNLKINGLHYLGYAITNNILMEGINPVVYAQENSIKIDGKMPLDYAMKVNAIINGKPAIEYALEGGYKLAVNYILENDCKVGDLPAIEYLAAQRLKVNGMDPYTYILKSRVGPTGININGKPAIEYFSKNNILVDNKEPVRYLYDLYGVRALKYAIDKGLKLDGESALAYAIKHNISISSMPAIKYAYEQGIRKIDNIDIFLYAQSAGYNIGSLSPISYAIMNDYAINSMPAALFAQQHDMKIGNYNDAVIFAIKANVKIAGIQAFDYAVDNNVMLDGMPAIEYVILNKGRVDNKHPIEYALRKGIFIDNKDPLLYIIDKKIDINGENCKVYALGYLLNKYLTSANVEDKSALITRYETIANNLHPGQNIIGIESPLGQLLQDKLNDDRYKKHYMSHSQLLNMLNDDIDISNFSLPLMAKYMDIFEANDDMEKPRNYDKLSSGQRAVVAISCILGPIAIAVYHAFKNHNQAEKRIIEADFNAAFSDLKTAIQGVISVEDTRALAANIAPNSAAVTR